MNGDADLSPGITTYPDHLSQPQQAIHQACLELERRYLIYRANQVPAGNHSPSSILWLPTE